MRWPSWKIPRELAGALLRTLFAVREAPAKATPAGAQVSLPSPRVRLVLPEDDGAAASAPVHAEAFPALLALLRGHGGFRTAEELAAEARRNGPFALRARDVRELFLLHGARHIEVRLREEAGSRVAEFRARPTA